MLLKLPKSYSFDKVVIQYFPICFSIKPKLVINADIEICLIIEARQVSVLCFVVYVHHIKGDTVILKEVKIFLNYIIVS